MKKILVAADMTTHPCIGGNNQCVMQYVNILRQLRYDVYYLLIGIEGISDKTIEATKDYWQDHFFFFGTPKLQKLQQKVIRRLLGNTYPRDIDFYSPKGIVKYVNRLHRQHNFTGLIVNYIWQSKLSFCDIPVKALFTHDVFSYRDERMDAGKNWHHYPVEIEAQGIRRFENVLAIQDVERDFFQYLSPKSKVISIYSSFDYISQELARNKNILFFSGGGDLNLNGINKYLDEVWPRLISEDQEIKLIIGGNICKYIDAKSLPQGVNLMGRYDDISRFYELGDIVINPIFEGSGLKIKTFEALAHGKTTVVDPHSTIGIYNKEKCPLLVAHNPEEYTALIMSRLRNLEKIRQDKLLAARYIADLNNYISHQYKIIFG